MKEQETYRLRLWNKEENNLEMPIKTDNTYNIDKKFDYFAVHAMVIESLERILLSAKQEQNHQGQQQQQQTIAFDYKALAAEDDDD